MKIPSEWKKTIKKSSWKHAQVAAALNMPVTVFRNALYGVGKLTKDQYNNLHIIIVRIVNGDSIFNKIVCKICENLFLPWNGDTIPICQECFSVSEYLREHKNVILKLLEIEKSGRQVYYWEHEYD